MPENAAHLPVIDAKTGLVNAVIETTKHSRAKLDFDPDSGFYKLHDILPEGFTFPFNFGFIPSTLAEDGDPLDVLILTDAELPCGLVLTIRLLGVIEAEETEQGRTRHNDRLVAVPSGDPAANSLHAIEDVPAELLDQFERFFKSYGDFKGKQWKTLGRGGAERALERVEQAAEQRRRKH